MSRRALLRVMLAAAAAPTLGAFAVRKGYPASAGYATVKTWRWVALPGAGLEVCVTAPGGYSLAAVEWTAGGVVTVLDLSATPGPTSVTVIMPGWSLSVRRILT